MRLLRFFVVLTVVVIFSAGCFEKELGKNENEKKPGNNDSGNFISNLSLSKNGRFLLRGKENVLRILDIETEHVTEIALEVGQERCVFGRRNKVLILKNNVSVTEYDMMSGEKQKTWNISDGNNIQINRMETVVVVWGLFSVTVIDTVNDDVFIKDFENSIVDVKWLPLSNELAVVNSDENSRRITHVSFFNYDLSEQKKIKIPNCPSSLEISPCGKIAMISPISCRIDPVSIIELERKKFKKNIPGFGPVAYSSDGKHAVSFARKNDLWREAKIEISSNYCLLLIKIKDFSFDVIELGDIVPVYTLTPNGELILLYDSQYYSNGVAVVDIETRTVRKTGGSSVKLHEFVITPDSAEVYLLYEETFYRFSTEQLFVEEIPLDCSLIQDPLYKCFADQIMITPDGSEIILGMENGVDFLIFDPVSLETKRILSMNIL